MLTYEIRLGADARLLHHRPKVIARIALRDVDISARERYVVWAILTLVHHLNRRMAVARFWPRSRPDRAVREQHAKPHPGRIPSLDCCTPRVGSGESHRPGLN